MALYSIESEQCLGMSHSGAVTVNGESTIELTDEEVTTLVQLIREKGTSDFGQLDLETSYPELYAKLDEAYHDMARHAEYMHWLWEGYNNGYCEYDEDELINYCERECGFSFEYDEDDYLDADGNFDEEDMGYAKSEAFHEWLDDYLYGLSDDDAAAFMCDHMDANIDVDDVEYTVDDVEYTVAIPQAIIDQAQQ